jgi:1,4-dihydroxy-2-naphthoate octaprenyltransferase
VLLTSVGIGALTCAILVANNLRDIAGDAAVGKRTLATRLGDQPTRILYAGLVLVGAIMIIVVAALTSWWALLGLAGLVLIIPAVRTVLIGGRGLALVGVLKLTGTAELAASLLMAAGLLLAR